MLFWCLHQVYRKLGKSLKGESKGKGRALNFVQVLFKKKFRKNDQFLSEHSKKSLGTFEKISRKNFLFLQELFEILFDSKLSTLQE